MVDCFLDLTYCVSERWYVACWFEFRVRVRVGVCFGVLWRSVVSFFNDLVVSISATTFSSQDCTGASYGLVELKNGETYNGHLVNCDTWMNIHLREVICTSKDGDRFWRMPECYIRGNTIKYLRVPDEVIDKVQEETKSRADRKPPGVGRGRGRGREDGPGGRPAKGVGRGIDDGGAKGMGGGRGKGGSSSKPAGNRAVEDVVVADIIDTAIKAYWSRFALLEALCASVGQNVLCEEKGCS
ncbi:unnamed protein product [Camellia sinensis]